MPVPSNKLTVPAIPMAGGTPPPTPPTAVPPPPKPPEYYTGYQTELQANAKNLYQSSKSMQAATLKLSQVSQTGLKFTNKYPVLGYLAGVIQGILDPSTRMLTAEDYQRDLASVQAEVNIATQKLQSDEWQAQVLHNLPAYLASRNYTVKSVDDVASLIPNANMTDADRVWLDSTFQKMSYLSNKLPADFSGTVEEAQQKIVDTVLTTPKLTTKAVHNLTVDELQRSFQSFATELPAGLTADDVRDILAKQNLEDDVLQRDISTYLAGKANDWAKETDRLNLLRAGLLNPESTDLTPGEFAKLMLVQPMMAGVELVNKYSDMLPRPLAAWYYINAFKVTHTTPTDTVAKMGQAFDYYKSQGESDWAAYAMAWNEADIPWYDRLISEAFFDPTSYIGLGVATALARQAGTVLTRVGLKSVGSRIGPMVAVLESGYVRGADAIFKGGMEVVISPFKGSNWLIETLRTGVPRAATYVIPKTLTQMSRNFARQASMNFKAVADQMFPAVKDMNGLTAKDIRDAAEASIKAAIERPTEGHDYMVRAGTNLLEFKYLDSRSAHNLIFGVGETVKEVLPEGGRILTEPLGELSTAQLAHLNNEVLNMFSGQPIRDTAGKIISNLGIEPTEAAVELVVKKLASFKDQTVANALDMFKSDLPKQQLIGMFDDLTNLRYENLQNPITSHMLQAGQAVSWISRMSDRLLQLPIIINMERKVNMPFARWNLLFANFGPMNYLENMQRSFLGGGEIMYPKSYSGVAETNRLFKGLAGAPYELQMAERGTARMEMALVDPKLGTTSAFRNGKIPFVTREVSVGGKVIGKKINIRGVDYKLTDMQSYNDMWEQMTTIQRAYDYQVHYMKALAENSPDEMNLIVKAVDSRLQLLKDIKVLSKSDVQDIRRTVIGMGTVGPEEFNRMAAVDVLELERRQISKTLGPVMDAATDVRAQIKQSLRNEILDGSIFKDIDGRFAAHIAESRELDLVSLAKQIDSLKDEAANFTKAYQGKAGLLDELTQDIKLGTPVDLPVTKAIPELGFREAPITLNGDNIGKIVYRSTDYIEDAKPFKEMVLKELNITKSGVLNRRTLQDIDVIIHDLAKRENFSKVSVISKKEHELFYKAGGYKKGAGPWYTKDVMQPVSHAPQNLDELLSDMDNITAMQNAVDERIHDYRRMVELRSQKLKPGKEVDDFHVGSNRLLNDFMVQSKESIDQMVSQLQDFTKNMTATRNAKGQFASKTWLSENQQAAVDGLSDVYKLENANVLNTRNRLAAVEKKITDTPPRNRDARFWQQQRAEKAVIWDEHTINSRRLRNIRLDASRQFLTANGKAPFVPQSIPPVTDKLTPSHIAFLYGVTGDDTYRGLTRMHNQVTVRPKEDWIDYTKNQANAYAQQFGKTANDIGFTDQAIGDVYDQMWRNLGLDPAVLTPDTPTVMQLNSIKDELVRLHATTKLSESDYSKWKQFHNGVAEDLKMTPMFNRGKFPKGENVQSSEWLAKKEAAVTEARKQHELAYPTYDDANVIDETMRAIFPFWTYELFRTRWIPRTFMRTPGTFTGVARFMDYTDGGYVPIPGTDLQINPLRGTIWAGGLRRMYTKDFPEYNDAFPGANLIDQIGRAGFYPGMNIMAPIAIFGQATGKPAWGDLMPTFAQTGLSALRAISPEHIGKVLDIVYPDRFRDYQTMLTLGEEGYDASAIWNKKQQGQKITPEEEKLWLQAENRANGLKGILMQQTGVLRLRPQEYDQVQKSMRLAIEEATGVPVKTQIQIDRNAPVTGKRFSDLYKLDVLQTKMLYQNESYKKWQGVATSLLPSGWQGMEVKIADYYDALEKNSTDARLNGVYQDGKLVQPSMADVNQQLVNGLISPSQWRTMRGNIQAAVVASNRAVGDSPAYKDVPKTLDERVAWLATKGVPTPTYGPDQELLWYYYQLRPEYAINPDTGANELDFDTYYAKVDMLLNSLAPEYKQRLLDRIQADWTPLERLYSNVSREYFAGYRNIRSIVLKEYTPEQQQAINRAIVARGDELAALQDIPGPDGNALVAGFSKRVRDARKSLRGVDPTLDAWSYFFGNTDSLVTTEAQTIYDSLATQYLNDSMVR